MMSVCLSVSPSPLLPLKKKKSIKTTRHLKKIIQTSNKHHNHLSQLLIQHFIVLIESLAKITSMVPVGS